jgi:hypothetical protein
VERTDCGTLLSQLAMRGVPAGDSRDLRTSRPDDGSALHAPESISGREYKSDGSGSNRIRPKPDATARRIKQRGEVLETSQVRSSDPQQ